MTRDEEMTGTFFVSTGPGQPTIVPVPDSHEAVVEVIGVATDAGGTLALHLGEDRVIDFGAVKINERLSVNYPPGLLVSDPGWDVELDTPGDGAAYIGGYYRHANAQAA